MMWFFSSGVLSIGMGYGEKQSAFQHCRQKESGLGASIKTCCLSPWAVTDLADSIYARQGTKQQILFIPMEAGINEHNNTLW